MAHVAFGAIDEEALDFLKHGQIAPLPKPPNGVRPLILSQFFRRLAFKALMNHEKRAVAENVGQYQYGAEV